MIDKVESPIAIAPLHEGDYVAVKELRDSLFYKCKVVQVQKNQIKIHYQGWNKKYDEWVSLDSDRLSRNVESILPPPPPSQPLLPSANDNIQESSSKF